MTGPVGYRLTQGLYYLTLGVWLGSMVMLAVAAPTIFHTVRRHEPTLQAGPYSAPALQDGAPGILAGDIVGRVLEGLTVVQIVCASIVAVTVAVQCGTFRRWLVGGVAGWRNLLRLGLLAAAAALLAASVGWIGPKVWENRTTMYDADAAPALREQARERFDRYHQLSERTAGAQVFLLTGAVLASPFVLSAGRPSEPDRL